MDDFASFITGGSAPSKKPQYSLPDVQNMIYGQESDFGKAKTKDPNYAGAVGPYQIVPKTFEGAKKLGLIPADYDINNPKHNEEAGKALIADSYKRYGGDADKVMAEYYAGPDVIKNGEIQTHWKDLKNAKAPTVGQYIEQAKTRFNGMGDDFSRFIMGGASNKKDESAETPTETKQDNRTSIAQMGDMSKKLGKEFIKPLSEISSEDWKEKSLLAPAIEYTASSLGIPGFTDADKKAAQEKLVKKGKGFVEGVTKLVTEPVNTISDIAKGIYENPAKFAGETVKSIIYDPEQLVAVPGAGKAIEKVAEGGSKAKAILAEKFNQAFPKMEQATPPVVMPAEATLAGVGAARAELNPYPKLTGEEVARGEMPQMKFDKMAGDVAPNEQAIRAQIINEINQGGRPRTGLITGNENTIRNEYALANAAERTPKGDILKQEIANEQQALPRYAENIVRKTGADQNLLDNESRAYRIRNALDSEEGLYKDIETAKGDIYKEAFAKVGNNPVEASNIEKLLDSKQFQAELKLKKLPDFTGGAKELLELHKTEGFTGTLPKSIAGLEKLRQSLNASWTPENSFAIRKATKAIDDDIAAAGGADTLVKARALHKAEKDLFGSKGIKDLLTETDVNGIQTGIPNEKLIQKLNIMPNDQWKHIYDTLGKAARGESIGVKISPEVQEAAKAAQAEMKGALAREIYEAGATKAGEWNANSVNKIANARMAKIKHSFSPDEIKDIYTLNYGGYLMPAKSPYEGAGMQTQRVNKLTDRLPIVGRAAGALTGIPGAETAGGYVGGKGSSFFQGRSQKKEAKALETELEKNKQLGTKLKDIGKE